MSLETSKVDAAAVRKPGVLFLSPIEPKADGNGVEKRGWAHLEALAQIADVHLVIAMIPAQNPQQVDHERLRPLCGRLDVLTLRRRSPPQWPLPLKLLWRLGVFGSDSVTLSREGHEVLNTGYRDRHYDLAFCFRIRSFLVWNQARRSARLGARKLFVDFDDIESLATWREIPFLRPVVGRVMTFLSRIEFLELWLLERRIQKQADAISICSDADQERLGTRGGKARIHVLPNSYPLTEQLPEHQPSEHLEILFLGTMAYPPNEDAILYFHDDILPRLREKFGDRLRLNVVGLRPGPRVLALQHSPNVTVTGGVPSVEPYYERADIVIAPIRFGGGTRIKILEALSYGRPVVASRIGAEGLGLRHEQDILFADGPEPFAAACIRLLEDEDLRQRLIRNGRKRVQENFERGLITADFQHRLLDLIS